MRSRQKNHAGPLMVRAYLSVRATGGAVASSPYRGRPWRGWMLLCFFLRAEESKRIGVWGYPPIILSGLALKKNI